MEVSKHVLSLLKVSLFIHLHIDMKRARRAVSCKQSAEQTPRLDLPQKKAQKSDPHGSFSFYTYREYPFERDAKNEPDRTCRIWRTVLRYAHSTMQARGDCHHLLIDIDTSKRIRERSNNNLMGRVRPDGSGNRPPDEPRENNEQGSSAQQLSNWDVIKTIQRQIKSAREEVKETNPDFDQERVNKEAEHLRKNVVELVGRSRETSIDAILEVAKKGREAKIGEKRAVRDDTRENKIAILNKLFEAGKRKSNEQGSSAQQSSDWNVIRPPDGPEKNNEVSPLRKQLDENTERNLTQEILLARMRAEAGEKLYKRLRIEKEANALKDHVSEKVSSELQLPEDKRGTIRDILLKAYDSRISENSNRDINDRVRASKADILWNLIHRSMMGYIREYTDNTNNSTNRVPDGNTFPRDRLREARRQALTTTQDTSAADLLDGSDFLLIFMKIIVFDLLEMRQIHSLLIEVEGSVEISEVNACRRAYVNQLAETQDALKQNCSW